jgi:hypothetical protein
VGSSDNVITRDLDVLGDTPVFCGSRGSIPGPLGLPGRRANLGGVSRRLPTVSREAAVLALEHAKSLVVSQLR